MHEYQLGSSATRRGYSSSLKQGWFVTVAFSVGLLIYFNFYDIRLLLYTVPFLVVIFGIANTLLSRNHIVIDIRAFIGLLLYISAFFLTYYSNQNFGDSATKDIVIISAAYLTFLISSRISDRMVIIVFAAFVINQVAKIIEAKNLSYVSFNLLGTTGIAETVLSYPFGLFSIYYFYRKKYIISACSALLMIVAFKRIAILAFIIALIAYGVLFIITRHFSKLYEKRYFQATLMIAITFSVYLCAIYINDIVVFSLEYFNIRHISPNELMSGRYAQNKVLYNALEHGNFQDYLFGRGAGMANLYISQFTNETNAGNSMLKLQYDYGIVGVILYFLATWVFLARNSFGIIVYLFTLVLMVIEPIVIFYYYHFLTGFLVMASANSIKTTKESKLRLNMANRFKRMRFRPAECR